MATLKGKGFFIWQIAKTENGDAEAIASLANQAGFSHVLIKIADREQPYNVDLKTGEDLVPRLAQALRARGLQVWGWHYIYGFNPAGEAKIAIQRIKQLNLDGYVIDAEAEFKQPGKDSAARTFMSQLRAALPTFPIALSSYRYPSFHPQLPWKEFLEKCDFNMPQVYWMQAHNPGEQLARCLREFQAMAPFRPIVPTGSAFKSGTWSPSNNEINEFLKTAQDLNLNAANFWEWANCRLYLQGAWDTIKHYSWSALPPELDISQQYVNALNSRDPDKVIALYNPTAVHVTAARTLQGATAIRNWYASFFNQILPNAKFILTGFSGTGSSRHLTWTATSSGGSVHNGKDTLGLTNGKIAYHYTFFTVS